MQSKDSRFIDCIYIRLLTILTSVVSARTGKHEDMTLDHRMNHYGLIFFPSGSELEQNFFQWNKTKTRTKNISFRHPAENPQHAQSYDPPMHLHCLDSAPNADCFQDTARATMQLMPKYNATPYPSSSYIIGVAPGHFGGQSLLQATKPSHMKSQHGNSGRQF